MYNWHMIQMCLAKVQFSQPPGGFDSETFICFRILDFSEVQASGDLDFRKCLPPEAGFSRVQGPLGIYLITLMAKYSQLFG